MVRKYLHVHSHFFLVDFQLVSGLELHLFNTMENCNVIHHNQGVMNNKCHLALRPFSSSPIIRVQGRKSIVITTTSITTISALWSMSMVFGIFLVCCFNQQVFGFLRSTWLRTVKQGGSSRKDEC